MANGSVVVSIHDVAASSLEEVRWLLGALDQMGIRPRVLKVVPRLDERHDLRQSPELVQVLRDEAAAGSEIVLHGFTHRAAGRLRGPWAGRVRAALFAGDAAEFLSLERPAMAERLVAGREALRATGLRADGFCPPAWLAPERELTPLLQELGFRHLIGMSTVRDLNSGRLIRLPWLGYMGSGGIQERLIGLAGRAMLRVATPVPAIKVFLHPQQARRSPACSQVLRSLAELVRRRKPVTYADLLDG